MRISDLIKMGLKNLSRRKARTALTVIGVVIGTISIIVMVSIGVGMNANYESQVMQSGSLTTIDVERDSWDENNDYEYTQQNLNSAFVDMVSQMDHVKAVSPYVAKEARLYSGKYQAYITMYAIDTSTMEEFEFPKVIEGLTPSEENEEVILFGNKIFENFWDPNGRGYRGEDIVIDPTKDRIKFGFSPYEYTLQEGKKQFTMTICNYGVLEATENYEDYSIFVDEKYFNKLYQKYAKTLKAESRKVALKSLQQYSNVKICVDSVKNVSKVQKQMEELGYKTKSQQSLLEPMQKTSNMLQLVLGCIGGVSMLVSAISIANTMIMSIYERTKEIGVMKVLGCFVRDIKKLFLFESAMIGFLGGALGIGLSYLASWAINKYGAPIFQSLLENNYMYDASASDFSMIPLWLPIVALLFAMLVGIVSGYYPARRATRISAIEAMKTES